MANTQLTDNFKVPYTLVETDADGNPATPAPGDTATVTSADTDSITVVPDETPVDGTVASGFLLGGKKLQVGVSVTALVTHTDGTTLGPVVDLIDVVGGAASTLAFGLGAPIPQ